MTSPDQNRPDLEDVRRRIDRVDRDLLDLIAERLALSADVRRAKAGAKLWRPSREDSHVADLVAAAHATGTPPALVSRVWAELMSASISVQGNTTLHVSLEGDARANLMLIRDRFGGSLPIRSYPTSSAALAATYADPEGICVLAAPGDHRHWWTALAPGGAMSELKIVAGLPRVPSSGWPRAVAIAAIDLDPQPGGRLLLALPKPDATPGTPRGDSGAHRLVEVAVEDAAQSALDMGAAIGYLPPRILD